MYVCIFYIYIYNLFITCDYWPFFQVCNALKPFPAQRIVVFRILGSFKQNLGKESVHGKPSKNLLGNLGSPQWPRGCTSSSSGIGLQVSTLKASSKWLEACHCTVSVARLTCGIWERFVFSCCFIIYKSCLHVSLCSYLGVQLCPLQLHKVLFGATPTAILSYQILWHFTLNGLQPPADWLCRWTWSSPSVAPPPAPFFGPLDRSCRPQDLPQKKKKQITRFKVTKKITQFVLPYQVDLVVFQHVSTTMSFIPRPGIPYWHGQLVLLSLHLWQGFHYLRGWRLFYHILYHSLSIIYLMMFDDILWYVICICIYCN